MLYTTKRKSQISAHSPNMGDCPLVSRGADHGVSTLGRTQVPVRSECHCLPCCILVTTFFWLGSPTQASHSTIVVIDVSEDEFLKVNKRGDRGLI